MPNIVREGNWIEVVAGTVLPSGSPAATAASNCALPVGIAPNWAPPSRSTSMCEWYATPKRRRSQGLTRMPALKPSFMGVPEETTLTCATSTNRVVKGLIAPTFLESLTSVRRNSGPAPIATQSESLTASCADAAIWRMSTRSLRNRPLNVSGFSQGTPRPCGLQKPTASFTSFESGRTPYPCPIA